MRDSSALMYAEISGSSGMDISLHGGECIWQLAKFFAELYSAIDSRRGWEYIRPFWGIRRNVAHITACRDSSIPAGRTGQPGSDRTFSLQSLFRSRHHRFSLCPHRAQSARQANLDHPRAEGAASLRNHWRMLADPPQYRAAGAGP